MVENVGGLITLLEMDVENDIDWTSGLKNRDLFGLFASPSSSAFHAICSLITRGVAASPSKGKKRTHCLKFFSDIHQNSEAANSQDNSVVDQYHAVLNKHTAGNGVSKSRQDADDIKSEEVRMNYLQIYEGLRLFSTRLSQFPIDELLTLAMLMDVNDDGIIDFVDFHDFCTVVDQSQHSHVNSVHCFECLFVELLQQKINYSTSLPKLEASLITLRQNLVPTMPLLLENLQEQAADVGVTPTILGDIFQSVVTSLRAISDEVNVSTSACKETIQNKRQTPPVAIDGGLWQELGGLRGKVQVMMSRLKQNYGFQDYENLMNALEVLNREIEKAHPANTDTYININNHDSKNTSSPNFKQSPIPSTSTIAMDMSNLSVTSSSSNNSYGSKSSGLPMGNSNSFLRSGNSLSRESAFVQKILSRHRKTVNDTTPRLSSPYSVSTLVNGPSEITTPSDDGSQVESSLNSSISTMSRRRSSFSPKSPFQATDLSIFKGPQSHIHGNKNVYNFERHTWQPTTTPKKDERFQTTHELRDLEKASKFLYNNH